MNGLACEFVLSCLKGLLVDERALSRRMRDGVFEFPSEVRDLIDLERGTTGQKRSLADAVQKANLYKNSDSVFLLVDPFFEPDTRVSGQKSCVFIRGDMFCTAYVYGAGSSLKEVSNTFSRLRSFNAFCLVGTPGFDPLAANELDDLFKWSDAFWVRAFDDMDFIFWHYGDYGDRCVNP